MRILGLLLICLLMANNLCMNYCSYGKCGLCQMADNKTDYTCKVCFYSTPSLISEGVYQCNGNEFPLENCIAVASDEPNSCSVCDVGYGVIQKQQAGVNQKLSTCQKLTIDNCRTGFYSESGEQLCTGCIQSYQLSLDKKSCGSVLQASKVSYCQEYQTDNNNKVFCSSCAPGYYLNMDTNTCNQSKDKSMCLITRVLNANDNGTCTRCDTSKFYFSVNIKDGNNNYQICAYNSYWSTGAKVGVVIAGVAVILIISVIVYRRASSKKVIEQRDQYVEA